MRRPIIDSGEARVIVYASRAGEKVTAMQLIRACENRERHMRGELQRRGYMVKRVDRLATDGGDIEIVAKWEVYGVKSTKRNRPDSLYNNQPRRRALQVERWLAQNYNTWGWSVKAYRDFCDKLDPSLFSRNASAKSP